MEAISASDSAMASEPAAASIIPYTIEAGPPFSSDA
jgi:hypothetical protein